MPQPHGRKEIVRGPGHEVRVEESSDCGEETQRIIPEVGAQSAGKCQSSRNTRLVKVPGSMEEWPEGDERVVLHTRYTGPPSTLGIVIHDAPPWTGEKASLGPTHTPQTSRELAGLCREDGGAGQRSDSGPHACVVTILLAEIPPQPPSILF